MLQIQYPIQTPEGDTIYLHGDLYESGTDEWIAERDRLQEKFNSAVESSLGEDNE